MKYLKSLIVASTCLLVAGCPQETSIWIVPGSSADQLVFVLGEERGRSQPISTSLVRVDRCEAVADQGNYPSATEAAWFVEKEIGPHVKLSQVTYGEVPQGYRETQPAEPLERPGCYLATISGTGAVGFEVDAQGKITEMSEAQREARGL